MTARLASPAYGKVRQSLADVGIHSVADLLGTYIGDRKDNQAWLTDAQINRDRNLRLQYLAGLALNTSQEDKIYRQIVANRKLPAKDFKGNPGELADLFDAMQSLTARSGTSGDE
jgi:spermidine synthase